MMYSQFNRNKKRAINVESYDFNVLTIIKKYES